MTTTQTQGIVLTSYPFKEKDRIIKVFTKDKGLISLIIKGLSSKRSNLLALSSNFCMQEFVYRIGKSEIFLSCCGARG